MAIVSITVNDLRNGDVLLLGHGNSAVVTKVVKSVVCGTYVHVQTLDYPVVIPASTREVEVYRAEQAGLL